MTGSVTQPVIRQSQDANPHPPASCCDPEHCVRMPVLPTQSYLSCYRDKEQIPMPAYLSKTACHCYERTINTREPPCLIFHRMGYHTPSTIAILL